MIFWVNKNENLQLLSQQISPAHRTVYFSHLLKVNLLSETIVSQALPAFICLYSTIIRVDNKMINNWKY